MSVKFNYAYQKCKNTFFCFTYLCFVRMRNDAKQRKLRVFDCFTTFE